MSMKRVTSCGRHANDLRAPFCGAVLLLFALAASFSWGAPPPDQREVWVPTDQLERVLKKYPKAVMVTREQYDTLLRDTERTPEKKPQPPRDAVLSAATYHARVDGHVLRVEAEWTVQVLSDKWATVPVEFGGLTLGSVQVDGDAALHIADPVPQETKGRVAHSGPAMLFVHGRGEHKIGASFTTAIATQNGNSRVQVQLPPAGSNIFEADLPARSHAQANQPLRVDAQADVTRVTAALAPSATNLQLEWRAAADAANSMPPKAQVNLVHIADAEKLRTDAEFTLSTDVGALPLKYEITVPAECTVLEVTGDTIANWTVAAGSITLTMQPGERQKCLFRLSLQQPVLAGQAQVTRELPFPRIRGVERMSGGISLRADPGVEVRDFSVGRPAEMLGPEGDAVGRWSFLNPPQEAKATFRKLDPSFFADLDTLVEFKLDAVYLERTVTVHEDKGKLFRLQIGVPAGEEILSVRGNEREADWRIEDGQIRIRWSDEIPSGKLRAFTIRSRTEPAKWAQPPPEGITFALGDAKVIGAQNVSGYIALKSDESFRLEAQPSDTLEPRDARNAPIQGEYAWFRRDAFALGVKVVRRPSEVLASVTGYALPLQGVLDIHAQLDWEFRHSGVRSVRVRVPKEMAPQFHFEGSQIAERNLVDDTWTITFQKELTGPYVMAVTVQTPITYEQIAENSSRFKVAIPGIEPLMRSGVSGTWAVEANTETEIELTSKEMNELDALSAPVVAGYQPSHRIIGVYGWLGTTYSLSLTGVRHAPAHVLTTVVDSMEINSVLSPSGGARTQAALQLRTAGAQFLDVALPAESHLLSLAVDEQAVKPVEGAAGRVRIQLPAKADPTASTWIMVLYENKIVEWRGRGSSSVLAPKLGKEIPVLRSSWHLFLPDGFRYSGFESNLQPPADSKEDLLVIQPLKALFTPLRRGVHRIAGIKSGKVIEADIDQSAMEAPTSPAIMQAPAAPLITMDDTERLRQKLQSIILPRLEFREATVQEAVDYLSRKLSESGLDRIELKGITPEKAAQKVTVSLSNIPASEALKYVTSLADLRYSIRGNSIVVSQFDVMTDTPIYQRTWRVPPKIFAIAPDATGALDAPARQSIDPKEYFAASGVSFPQGASLSYTASTNELNVRNTEENIDLINALIASQNSGVPDNTRSQIGRSQMIYNPLSSIIIPRLELREATLREAIDFLVKKSAELSPTHERINIVLKIDSPAGSQPPEPALSPVVVPGLEPVRPMAPSSNPVAAGSPADARITVSLSNVSLGEALKYITSLANVKYKVEDYAIVIVPLTVPTETLLNREWKVPPGMFASRGNSPAAQNDGGSGLAARMDAKDFLAANGVSFPPGSSAIFLASSGKIIIKNTQENLDLVDAIVQPARQMDTGAQSMLNAAAITRVVGLIPIKLELPKAGRTFTLEGLMAPDRVTFRYDNWWSRARSHWWYFVAGGLTFFLVGRGRHWWKAIWAIFFLTAIPVCLSPGLTAICNALLAGWILALILERIGTRMIPAPARKEALAS